jgi:L-methionine (R)-S-oxide reductase
MTEYHSIDYLLLNKQLAEMMSTEFDPLANSSNFVALMHHAFSDINWLGIYVLRDDELVLGPFQGKPACVRIPLGSGVCGNAAKKHQTMRIDDVHKFEGHIACDLASRSEIVIPLLSNGVLLGVLDIDSPDVGRFSAIDQTGIEKLCETFVELLERREIRQPGFI